uniref:Uncharacterized protein n=1 Tax=Ditylenchus dipsaci TaxID=166011 RepID=A0A915EMR9_9BILA
MSRTRMSVKSGCYPSCNLSLPRIGTVSILSRLDVCKSPAILTLSVMSDGRRSLNTFVAGNQQQEVRTIGNEYWPMHLRVSFSRVEQYDEHFVEACIETVRTGNISCFMNGFLPLESGATDCSTHKSDSNFPMVLLCIILATCFLMIGITVTISLVQSSYHLGSETSSSGVGSAPKSNSECNGFGASDLAKSNPLLTMLNMKNSQSYQPENQLKPPCNITHSTAFLQSFKQ